MHETQYPLSFMAAIDPAVHHTPGHLHCLACEQSRQTTMFPIAASMPFADAAANFLESITAPIPHAKARYRAANTIRD